jgi:ferritin
MHADVLRAINVQINSEFSAWYQYLAMAAFCDREKFVGAARWLREQSLEEYQHGMKLFDFVLARNGVVELITIDQPTRQFDSFAEVFESALKKEERVTQQINDLYELCFKCKAFAEMRSSASSETIRARCSISIASWAPVRRLRITADPHR